MHGPTSIAVAPTRLPSGLNTWVMPIFLPRSPKAELIFTLP